MSNSTNLSAMAESGSSSPMAVRIIKNPNPRATPPVKVPKIKLPGQAGPTAPQTPYGPNPCTGVRPSPQPGQKRSK
jgi:hypothetical protein